MAAPLLSSQRPGCARPEAKATALSPHSGPDAIPESCRPGKAQAGLSGCGPSLSLTSSTASSGHRLTRRRQPCGSWSGALKDPAEAALSCLLLSLTCVIMPRGRKSKCRARIKRHQARLETQNLQGARATEAAAAEGETPSSPSSVSQGSPPSSPAAGTSQQPEGAVAPSSPEAGGACSGSEQGAQSQEERASASQAACSAQSSLRDPLTRKACKLMQFLLEKYKTNEPITQTALLKIVNRKYKEHFPEILRRVSERLELVFGLELKEVDPSSHSYALVCKLGLPSDENLSGDRGLPKSGLLMTLLGVIFMKGNRATEEEKYLEYRQVPDSDPPRYEFLWGPKAHAETTKMKVLEVLAKINACAKARACSKAKSCSSSQVLASPTFLPTILLLTLPQDQKSLVSKLDNSNDGNLSGDRKSPKTGLASFLDVIFMMGNHVTEEEIQEFLKVLVIHDGKRYFISGDPQKLTTKDLVQEEYTSLECQSWNTSRHPTVILPTMNPCGEPTLKPAR
ncbi:melanoma-associated antigen B1-like protein [Camelus ferus]|nr:melanoma-associated antigen B1-like protein [Camelus ferus]